jgi:thiamine-phosphate pyrophosphorylase
VKPISECRLYGILDTGYVPPGSELRVAAQLISGGIDVLQLRAKDLPVHAIEKLGRDLLPLTSNDGVPLIVNDYPDIAATIGAQGVHVGQDDVSVCAARRAAGERMIVGKSTHSIAQAEAACDEGADYIGFGPLFATPTKPDYPPIGTDAIATVHERLSIPIFCIGGIKLSNLQSVLDAGAKRVVIVSGFLQASDPAAAVARAREQLRSQ